MYDKNRYQLLNENDDGGVDEILTLAKSEGIIKEIPTDETAKQKLAKHLVEITKYEVPDNEDTDIWLEI